MSIPFVDVRRARSTAFFSALGFRFNPELSGFEDLDAHLWNLVCMTPQAA